jgi:hypothetical protein
LIFLITFHRFGKSRPLLKAVDLLHSFSPHTAVAPQVTLRSARVMKDEGDLNGALKVINAIISRGKLFVFISDI